MRDEQIAMTAGGVSLALLLGALGFQYLGHVAPCEMCHWQRWPLIAAAVVGLGGGFLAARGKMKDAFILALAALLLIFVSGAIGAYQTGMQWGFLPGPSACTGERYIAGSGMITHPQCDVVTWSLFGLSLAAYNAVICLASAVTGTVLLLKNQA